MTRAGASWFVVIPFAMVAPAPALATVYMSVEQAQQAMFPGARFVDRSITFTDAQKKAIAKASGTGDVPKIQRVWEVRSAAGRSGWFILDRVLGKHELITYALALAADGTIRGIEILEYRETYGGEIRNPNWRRQFVGKRPGSAVRLDQDIKNISGATLSSRHVTDGVRRLLVTYQMLLANA